MTNRDVLESSELMLRKQLEAEVQRLRNENAQLRERVAELEAKPAAE